MTKPSSPILLLLAFFAFAISSPAAIAETENSDQAPATEETASQETPEVPAPNEDSSEETAQDEAEIQETAPPAPPAAIDPEVVRSFEGIGLYNRSSALSMGDEFWNDASRSTLLKLYREMPAVSDVPAIQKLIRRSLLTQADPKGINNDIPIAPGEDFLTVRLEKLLEAGLYSEARALYGALKDDPYHDRLIRAGMLATLFSGEKGLVCIDSNTFKDGSAPGSFVQLISAYCEVAASENPSAAATETLNSAGLATLKTLAMEKTRKIPYDSAAFSELSLIEQAVIVAEKRLDLSGLTAQKIKSVPPSHLPFLIDATESNDFTQFSLMVRAIEWGFPYQDALKSAYMSALPTAGGDAAKPKADSTVEKIAVMYSDTINADNDQKAWSAIEAALAYTSQFGPGAMAPFADSIADVSPPQALRPETLVQIYSLFLHSGQKIPYQWASYKIEPEFQKIGDSATIQQSAAAYFMTGSAKEKDQKMAELLALVDKNDRQNVFFLDNIIENVDNPNASIHNSEKIYEKEFSLTFRQDYVMPSMRTWKRLLNAGENRNVTETALLSTILLQDQSLQNIYPGLLSGVLNSLEYVGLTDVSTELAVYASIRNIK
jgi:hypothetical protein